jgi:hypothetical protein
MDTALLDELAAYAPVKAARVVIFGHSHIPFLGWIIPPWEARDTLLRRMCAYPIFGV